MASGRLVAAWGVMVCFGCGRPSYPQSASHPLLGQPLPGVHHQATLDGRPFDSDELAGKRVLVKFFAEYCKPCTQTLPAAERLHEAYPDVAFVGIDEDDSRDAASALVRRYALTFPVIHDEGNVLSGRFRVSTMPMAFVADASGTIRWVGDEGQTESELRSALEAVE